MTDHNAYWSRLEEAARAEATALNGGPKPDLRAMLDRILYAAAPAPAGIAHDAAGVRALEVAVAELERLNEAQRTESDTLEKLARLAKAPSGPKEEAPAMLARILELERELAELRAKRAGRPRSG